MRSVVFLSLVGATALIAVSCNKTQPPPSSLQPEATIKDIMDSMVDPSADVLWQSVATIVTAAGTDERQPKTDDDWKTFDRSRCERSPHMLG